MFSAQCSVFSVQWSVFRQSPLLRQEASQGRHPTRDTPYSTRSKYRHTVFAMILWPSSVG